MTNSRYTLLGTEELDWTCDFCGKKEISICFVVVDNENGDIKRFGSSCIKKALHITSKDIRTSFENSTKEITSKYFNLVNPLEEEVRIIADTYRKENKLNQGFLPQTETTYWNLQKKLDELRIAEREEKKRFII